MTADVELARAAEIDALATAGGESGDVLVSGGDVAGAGRALEGKTDRGLPLLPHHVDEQHVDLPHPTRS